MCSSHSGLPLGKPGVNFTPTMQAVHTPCNKCDFKATQEKEISFFNKYRSMSSKQWAKEEEIELHMLAEM
jgi:hypothetical protein